MLRSGPVPPKVGLFLEEACPAAVRFLAEHVAGTEPAAADAAQADGLAAVFTCLSHWIHSGVTLSELHDEHPALLAAALRALGSPSEALFDSAAELLGDLVSEVDGLPGRTAAVNATVA
eukprot:SM006175S19971  [mRNA]  locus=s6175:55:799:+ [translate_table: standard]